MSPFARVVSAFCVIFSPWQVGNDEKNEFFLPENVQAVLRAAEVHPDGGDLRAEGHSAEEGQLCYFFLVKLS